MPEHDSRAPIPISNEGIPGYLKRVEANGTGWIRDILEAMADVVPLDISLAAINDINEHLTSRSSSFNMIWKDHGRTVGFLVCEELEYKGERSLYILYFGFIKPEGGLAQGTVSAQIKKIIKDAGKDGFTSVSCHGYNPKLNSLLTERFGFQHIKERDLLVGPRTAERVPFLVLALTQQEQVEASPASTEIDLTDLERALQERMPELTEAHWQLVQNKVQIYLQKIAQESPPNGWQSLADAITQSWEAVTTTPMGIAACIEEHKKKNIEMNRQQLREHAENDDIEPELLVSTATHSLVRLTTKSHLLQESAVMINCVGNSDHYLKEIQKGESEIWSLRDSQGDSLLTMEYRPKKKLVRQMKKFNDSLVTGEEPWFPQIWELLTKLQKLPLTIPIVGVSDLGKVAIPSGQLLTLAGEFQSLDEIDQLIMDNQTVVGGEIQLTNTMTDEDILQWCRIPGMTVDTTHLSDSKRGVIRTVKGNLKDGSTKFIRFDNLEAIEGNADFDKSQVEMAALQTIGGDAKFIQSKAELPKLRKIEGDAEFEKSQESNLSSLESIDGNAFFAESKITKMRSLRLIRGWASFKESEITELPNLFTIGGSAEFGDSRIMDLSSLSRIDGYANFGRTRITDIPKLEIIGKEGYFVESKVTNLSSLKKISWTANFVDSVITEMPSLQSIGGAAYFRNSQITELSSLERIGGKADFANSKIKNLQSLQKIRGPADFKNTPITEIPNLLSINGSEMRAELLRMRFSLKRFFFG